MKARVYKSTGSRYIVKTEVGRFVEARLRGNLRIDGITSTNPIAVGDFVQLTVEGNDTMIVSIDTRHNYIARQSPNKKQSQHHIIASNLNRLVLVATLRNPRTSSGFIDRFLVTAEAFHIPAILVFNKKDLWSERDEAQHAEWKEMYESIGYPTLAVSSKSMEGLDELRNELEGKTTLFSGHSGVGKSSLLNALMPGLAARTGEISEWSGKGLHTTTFAEMFDYSEDARIIDTPGVKEFGLIHLEKAELSHYFPEMRAALEHCRYNDCKHINEPGCAVRNLLLHEGAEGALPVHEERYINYVNMLESIEKKW